MLKINSNLFNFLFFLSDTIEVDSLESGATQHGGATKINNKVFSNIPGSDFINLNKDNNKISIFVPSTTEINKASDNTKYINYSINYLQNIYQNKNLTYELTTGSWYSEDLNKVIIEDITIITLELNQLTEIDINNFIQLANYIKYEMSQEAVTITVNSALAII